MSRSASRIRADKSRAAPAPVLPPPPSPDDHVDSDNIAPGHLSKSEWMDMVAQEEGEEVVAEVLDELLCNVMKKCYQVYLQRQLVPFTVAWAQHFLVHTLEWQFLVRDEGEGHDSAPVWEQDSEPQPGDIDSWAQGCVPVVYSRPTPKNILLQRSVELPVADSVNPGRPLAKDESQSGRKEEHNDRHPCSADRTQNDCQTLKAGILIPCPPSKRENKKKHPLPHCTVTQAPHTGTSPCISRGPVSHSLSTEKHPIPKNPAISVSNPKRAQKLPDLSAVKRLDPASLVRHQVWPAFEVLEPSVSHPRVPPIPHQKQGKHNAKQPAALKPPAHPHKVRRRRTVDGALWVSSGKADLQDVGQPQGSRPISAGLLLDTMVLSPGVSLNRGVHTNTYKRSLSLTGQRASLEPIRSSLPAPLFSTDQLTSG
ncbi:uncharacterized protein C2orf81 homolog [Conger conger]|uniref:uncharacterized protein C2orf81 homolog n=1 Tax=Conger conger TaxID=82655 RepID=UPI002A5AEB44|nr:uncharacterized protein C2orf81 homolog [Conger conger]